MKRPTLLRSLGISDATLLVVGCIIGVGIFRTSSSIATHIQSPSLILALWVFTGLLSLCGALCYAELASMFPQSGGDYIYITTVYGRFWGFLFGWTKLFIERTGTIAILGMVFAEYFRHIVPYSETAIPWVAGSAILLLTAINVFGIRWGKYVQNIFTVIKIGALLTVIGAGYLGITHVNAPVVDWSFPSIDFSIIQHLGVALVFVLWTYGGWTEAAYVAEEVKDPTRNVPRAIIGGVLLVTCLYLFVNWSYLLWIPMELLSKSPMVASDVMQYAFGASGAVFIAWMIACSSFGALNGYILTGGRILYAIGADHGLFAKLSSVHPRFNTPAFALWVNAIISIGLVCTKTFDQIVTYSTVVISVFFTMAVFSVIVLRIKQPNLDRPYRAWGYPVTPILFCLTMIGFIIDVCIKQPQEMIFGFGLLFIGIPLYWLSNRFTIPHKD